MKSLLDEQLKINQRTYQEASQAQEILSQTEVYRVCSFGCLKGV